MEMKTKICFFFFNGFLPCYSVAKNYFVDNFENNFYVKFLKVDNMLG